MKLYGRELSQESLLRYAGSVAQLGGIEAAELTEGASRGVRKVTIDTAEGLSYAVNPDCGLSISSCSYKGIPLCWKSGTGVSNPGLYDEQLSGWLRSFNGGLLVSCGLSQIGAPCVDEGVSYGLHGRISNTPAEITALKGEWIGDRYGMLLEGILRESMALGPRLVLRRRIFSYLDSSEISVEDSIANESCYDAPLLLSYHINFGFPFITESARVRFDGAPEAAYYNEASKARGLDGINACDPPARGFAEQIYLQSPPARDGLRSFSVTNTVGDEALCARVSYSENLTKLIHWRQFGEGDYVLGFEPANTAIGGRAKERAAGNVVTLPAWGSVKYALSFRFSSERAADR